jgi:hypothetical protein
MRPIGSILCGLLMLGAASTARAEDATTPTQQLTLPKGKLVIDAFVDINLSTGSAFDPVSISPDIWYGVNDDITVGLVHSVAGQFGFISGPGNSLCLGDACGGVYDNLGVSGRFRLKAPWVIDAGVVVDGLSTDAIVGAKIGASARWTLGKSRKIILELQPSVVFVFVGRDFFSDALLVPVTLGYAVSPKLQVGLQTGLIIPFENTGDNLGLPLSLMGRFRINPKASLGLAFTFGQLDDGVDARSLTLGVSYAL